MRTNAVTPRARALRIGVGVLFATALSLAALTAVRSGATPAAGAATPAKASRVRWIGHAWFLNGVNLPTIHACDFGCGASGGVRVHQSDLEQTFARLDADGTRV